MGTKRKILQMLLVAMLLVMLVGIIAIHFNSRREQLIIDYNLVELNKRTKAVVKEQEHKIYQVIYDYTYWDPFVEYIQNHDQAWAEENITSIIYSFKLESVWVVDINGGLLFHAFDSTLNEISLKFDKKMLLQLYENRSINYYENTPDGLLMIQGATIHPTNDPGKLTNPQAYFFMVKRWNDEVIQSVEAISGCKVTRLLNQPDSKIEVKSDSISVMQVMKSWDKQDAGYIVFKTELGVIHLLRRITIQMEWLLIVSTIGIFVFLGYLLSHLVTKPLRLVSEIVENEDLSKINLLKKNSKDFERIGLLIEQFVKQKKDLVHAMNLAKASDQIKTEFLNNISHEVRTPLNGIVGASTLLSEPDISQEVRDDMIAIMNESTQRLLRTITQYMDISLLSSDNMPLYPLTTELPALLRPIIDEHKAACHQKQIEWIVEFPKNFSQIKLLTDKSLVEKILNHLLDNALKFIDKGSIKFSIQIEQSLLVFCVKDTGVGIDQKVKPYIFKNFTQEDTSNLRRYEGSGLGLAICYKAAQLLGGEIWFDSEKGKGTEFFFALPYNDDSLILETDVNLSQTKHNMVNQLVLIAEDDDSNYLILDKIIHRYFNVDIARALNGIEAIDYCRKNTVPCLILMDIKMPLMDGHEATRIIKQQFPDVPIIAVTAYGLSGDEHNALESGCDDYISKPINSKILLDKLEKYLEYLKPKS
jgi:signal transduction histidine kinase/ActR/RegA family two-component response regulator